MYNFIIFVKFLERSTNLNYFTKIIWFVVWLFILNFFCTDFQFKDYFFVIILSSSPLLCFGTIKKYNPLWLQTKKIGLLEFTLLSFVMPPTYFFGIFTSKDSSSIVGNIIFSIILASFFYANIYGIILVYRLIKKGFLLIIKPLTNGSTPNNTNPRKGDFTMKILNFLKRKELNKIKELENEIANLLSLASPDVQRMYELKEEISTLEQTLQEKEIDANTKIENFTQSIESLQGVASSLNTTLNNLNTEITNKKRTLSEINDITSLKDVISSLNTKVDNLNTQISDKKQLLIEMDEEIIVQEFGLYTPYYDFASALDYKEELARIRAKQKDLIKNNKATHGNTQWTVNNNRQKGEKMVKDTQKLLLRAFNSECDTIVSKVKYTNFDASLDRIYKVAEAISKLGSLMEISVTDEYLNCKVKELRLAFEYQQKKQQEKEELREARAAQREAAKLQKEIEAERKKFEKEQTHYETALLKILKALHNEPENQELIAKKEELEQHLVEVEQSLKDIDYREANQKAGYVYIISNIGAFGENVFKIGMTRRLDPQERIDELSGASVPFRFDVHAMIFSDDAPALEAALHRAFEDKKMNMVNNRKEFFKVTLDEIKEVIRQNFDKTVEFTDVADAEQYRVSLKMKE